jgi:hypothetical protein
VRESLRRGWGGRRGGGGCSVAELLRNLVRGKFR